MSSSVRSMTGFGQGEGQLASGTLRCEVKSVNHRFFDLRLKGDPRFQGLLSEIQALAKKYISRGSLDCTLTWADTEHSNTAFEQIDWEKTTEFIGLIKRFAQDNRITLQFGPQDFLREEFRLDSCAEENDGHAAEVLGVVETALKNLSQKRAMEGENLKNIISDYERAACDLIKGIGPKHQRAVEQKKEKIEKAFRSKQQELELDERRLGQELIFYLEKLDIAEEVQRFEMHLSAFAELFADVGPHGRKADFLLQELGREANTIGSKTPSLEASSDVVELKTQLEKMREQIQNVE